MWKDFAKSAKSSVLGWPVCGDGKWICLITVGSALNAALRGVVLAVKERSLGLPVSGDGKKTGSNTPFVANVAVQESID